MPIADAKSGDRYVVADPFETIVMVQFFAPCSAGATRWLPEGLEFAIWGDPVPEARAVSARPVDPGQWERELVSSENLNDEQYGGYSLVINKTDLTSRCTKVR